MQFPDDRMETRGLSPSHRWYAIQTRPRHEKKAASGLEAARINTFLPLVTEVHRWSDRRQAVQLPLFPSYLFVCILPCAEIKVRVLRTLGVIKFVGANGEGLPVPEAQIEDVRALLTCRVPVEPYPFLKVGQRVRICDGSLAGMEGVLVSQNGNRSLVVSVHMIQRSVVVRLEGFKVEPVSN